MQEKKEETKTKVEVVVVHQGLSGERIHSSRQMKMTSQTQGPYRNEGKAAKTENIEVLKSRSYNTCNKNGRFIKGGARWKKQMVRTRHEKR